MDHARDRHHDETLPDLPPLYPRSRSPAEQAARRAYYSGGPAFVPYDLRPEAIRADPTGTGNAELNARADLVREQIMLTGQIVRDLVSGARKRRQSVAQKRATLDQIEALFADAEAHAREPWAPVILLDLRLTRARDTLRAALAATGTATQTATLSGT